MEQTVICLLMVQKFINLQQKIMIIPNNLCLGNVSKDFSAHNMKKKTGFNGYIYDFSVDDNSIDVKEIKDIHKYLMKKNKIIYKCLNLLSKYFFNNVFW